MTKKQINIVTKTRNIFSSIYDSYSEREFKRTIKNSGLNTINNLHIAIDIYNSIIKSPLLCANCSMSEVVEFFKKMDYTIESHDDVYWTIKL